MRVDSRELADKRRLFELFTDIENCIENMQKRNESAQSSMKGSIEQDERDHQSKQDDSHALLSGAAQNTLKMVWLRCPSANVYVYADVYGYVCARVFLRMLTSLQQVDDAIALWTDMQVAEANRQTKVTVCVCVCVCVSVCVCHRHRDPYRDPYRDPLWGPPQ